MCDSGLTRFMYWALGAAGAQLYINPVNPESHIWQYHSRETGGRFQRLEKTAKWRLLCLLHIKRDLHKNHKNICDKSFVICIVVRCGKQRRHSCQNNIIILFFVNDRNQEITNLNETLALFGRITEPKLVKIHRNYYICGYFLNHRVSKYCFLLPGGQTASKTFFDQMRFCLPSYCGSFQAHPFSAY